MIPFTTTFFPFPAWKRVMNHNAIVQVKRTVELSTREPQSESHKATIQASKTLETEKPPKGTLLTA